MHHAVIDCGTNTFHLLVAEVMPDGQIRQVFKERRYVRLGENGLDHIGEAPFQRGIDCLQYFKEKMMEIDVAKSCVFGTEALRRASNGGEFARQVLERTGIQIQIISGEEEARLIHMGAMQAVPEFSGKALIMDVGGGSVEFIIASGEGVFWAQSFPIGVQVLFSKFHQNDPISKPEREALETFLGEKLRPLFAELKKHGTPHLIGASGSFEVVESMLVEERESPLHTIVPTTGFYQVFEKIMASTLAERYASPDIPDARAELIVVAFALIDFILRKAKIQQIITSAYAMKEGMLLTMNGGRDSFRQEG